MGFLLAHCRPNSVGHHITENLLYGLSRKAAACCQFGRTPYHWKSSLKSHSALHTEVMRSGPIKTEHDVLVEKSIKGAVCME